MQETLVASVNEQAVVQNTLNSLHKVGLAGLGACSRVQREGNKLLVNLVAKGEALRTDLQEKLNAQVDNAEQRFDTVVSEAKDTWDGLGKSLQGCLGKAAKQIGVASKDDVNQLSELVEKLDRSVLELAEARKQAPQAPLNS